MQDTATVIDILPSNNKFIETNITPTHVARNVRFNKSVVYESTKKITTNCSHHKGMNSNITVCRTYKPT